MRAEAVSRPPELGGEVRQFLDPFDLFGEEGGLEEVAQVRVVLVRGHAVQVKQGLREVSNGHTI